MATHKDVTIDTGLTVLRSGISWPDSDEPLCYVYVVLNLDDCKAYVDGREHEVDAAHDLTGWEGHSSGPGGAFADPPWMRVYGKKVLVAQRRGRDV